MDNPTLERRLKAKDKLIAELLEALEACVKCLTMDSDMEEDFAPEIAQATEAIRKAKE